MNTNSPALTKFEFPQSEESLVAYREIASRYALPVLAEPAAQARMHEEILAAVPAVSGILDGVRASVAADCAALISGVPVELDSLLVGVMNGIGTISLQIDDDDPDASRLVWDVKPTASMDGHSEHGSKSRVRSPLHTDSVQVTPRDRYLALACVENSREQGSATVVLPIADLLPEVSEADLKLLCEPAFTFSKTMHGAEASTTTTIIDEVVDADGTRHPAVRYSEKSLEMGRAAGHEPPAEHQAALDRFHELARWERGLTEVWLEPNEVLVFDNSRVLHGRGEISGTKRHLKRLRAAQRAGRP